MPTMFQPFAALFRRGCLAASLVVAGVAQAQALPPEARQALERAGVPAEAIAVVVHDAHSGKRVLSWQENKSLNPASLMKLATTSAALERLGPAYSWATPVWLVGTLKDGVLEGAVHIKGSGDPKLVVERVWLLLRRLQQQGVREIRGDIVLDNSAFVLPEVDPGEFDGEPLRPYNVRPSALLLNLRSVLYSFVPDEANNVARVVVEPTLAQAQVDRSVPLVAGPCGDWRANLKASFDAGRVRFAGSYPAACGELVWPLADPMPLTYDARLLQAMWLEMGGQLSGTVREGPAPADTKPHFELRSPPLAEVVRDINKFSNNLMAQQLFLTLGLQGRRNTSADTSRELLMRWLAERTGELGGDTLIDNGSGLSRSQRITAARLARLLLYVNDSPVMSELMSSLPITGTDGTLRRSRATAGRAHLKTGSLRDVAGVAGWVLSNSGKRYVVVALINHPGANAARPALEAVVQHVMRDLPGR
jgi:serine-type D-Ala-D-Ala carboxypeptidase/endopeptidase (penicillin-binding protein 4)